MAMPPVPEFLAPVMNLGAMGCILLWFMFRSEARQKAQEEATDRLTRSITLALLAQQIPPYMETACHNILKETEVAEIERRPKK